MAHCRAHDRSAVPSVTGVHGPAGLCAPRAAPGLPGIAVWLGRRSPKTNSPAWKNHRWLVRVSSFPPWVFHPSKFCLRKTLVFKPLRLVAWVRAMRRMLPPPKKRKVYDASIKAEDEADDDLDESDDDKPDWHASFNLQSRTAMVSDEAWVQVALGVSTKLRARELKHVMWWDAQALNPERAALYALPHLNYTHNTGVVEFSVPPACCQPLASFLDDMAEWIVV